MKKLMLALSMITLSSTFTVQAFSQDIIVPKNHKGEAMTLAALAKDAAWRQKVAQQWKTSQRETSWKQKSTSKTPSTRVAFYILDNAPEASHYNAYTSKYVYN